MMTTKEEKRELLHRQWKEQIAECESSNMPVKEWCAENGVNLNTFYARISALKKDKLKQSGIVKKCAVEEYPKSWIGRYQAA